MCLRDKKGLSCLLGVDEASETMLGIPERRAETSSEVELS